MNVYDSNAFEDRVNYAASCIAKGEGMVPQGRHFDTCFEMSDGDYVIAALVRRTLKVPTSRLAMYLFHVINRDIALEKYEKTKHLSRMRLREAALRRCS